MGSRQLYALTPEELSSYTHSLIADEPSLYNIMTLPWNQAGPEVEKKQVAWEALKFARQAEIRAKMRKEAEESLARTIRSSQDTKARWESLSDNTKPAFDAMAWNVGAADAAVSKSMEYVEAAKRNEAQERISAMTLLKELDTEPSASSHSNKKQHVGTIGDMTKAGKLSKRRIKKNIRKTKRRRQKITKRRR
jgi:hypothetical protein